MGDNARLFDVVSLLCFIIGTQIVSLQITEVCVQNARTFSESHFK
jgi:hypothetical protein